jgi:transketolase
MATGTMLYMAIEAAEKLAEEGISARVTNVHTIKPIDKEDIIEAAKTTGCIVTAEEHNILGGLGSAVAEVVCECFPVPVLRVGVEDKFGKSGKVPALLEAYCLTTENIVAKAKAAIAAKK